MSRNLIWIDSVAMGAVLVIVGVAICLAGVGVRSPLYLGPLLLGILLGGVGLALIIQGLRHRPAEVKAAGTTKV